MPQDADANRHGGLAATEPADRDVPEAAAAGSRRRPSAEYDRIVDPDVDLHDPAQRREIRPRQWDLVLAVAAGGVLGAEGRYGLGLAVPHSGAQFPWATVIINATGSALIGILMVIVFELTAPHRLVRPFLGVGVLGGFTTFSTFAVDAERLVQAHRPLIALGYVAITLATCGLGVWLAATMTKDVGEAVIAARTRRSRRRRVRSSR